MYTGTTSFRIQNNQIQICNDQISDFQFDMNSWKVIDLFIQYFIGNLISCGFCHYNDLQNLREIVKYLKYYNVTEFMMSSISRLCGNEIIIPCRNLEWSKLFSYSKVIHTNQDTADITGIQGLQLLTNSNQYPKINRISRNTIYQSHTKAQCQGSIIKLFVL